MRVLVLNWRDMKNPTAGGAEVVADNIVRGLAASGHDVTYFTSSFPGAKETERLGGAKVVRRGSMFTVYVHAFLYYMKHRDEFDFVIESVSAVPFFTPLYFDRKKVMIIPHHIVGKVIFKELPLPSALIAYLAESAIPSFYKKTSVVAVSEAVRSELIQFGIDRKDISICYFGPFSSFKPVKAKKFDRPTLVTVTRLMKYKRVDLLLDALKEIKDARLIVCGEGKEMASLRSHAKAIGVSHSVEFVGWIDERQKAQLLAKAWLFVTASEREGFGISALEAEMSGTPVVAFRVGGLSEAVKDGYSGFLVNGSNIKEFAARISRLLTDAKLRAKMSSNSIDYSKRFDPKEAIKKIEAIMKSRTRKL